MITEEKDLTESQIKAMSDCVNWYEGWINHKHQNQVFTIAGFAGTGKTEVVRHMERYLGIEDGVKYLTYTGKASLVLHGRGCNASTIHNFIYVFKDCYQQINPDTGKREKVIVFDDKDVLPANTKIIVVDEVSMVSERILNDILKFGYPVIGIGDPCQLNPVKEEAHNLLSRPNVFLKEIHRQASDNPIIRLSMQVRSGDTSFKSKYGDPVKIMTVREKDLKDDWLLRADQVICGRRVTANKINMKVRSLLGFNHEYPEEGDRVICSKNNWNLYCEGVPLVNGMHGYIDVIRNIDYKSMIVDMDFLPDHSTEGETYTNLTTDLHDFLYMSDRKTMDSGPDIFWFEYGHAITCHKSQGSEFGKVILFDESKYFKKEKINWLYTGITRAVDKLIIVV